MTTVPYFQLNHDGDDWTDEMSTDVLVEMFDFGEYTEQDLDKLLAVMAVGDELALKCSYLNDPGHVWTNLLRRVS